MGRGRPRVAEREETWARERSSRGEREQEKISVARIDSLCRNQSLSFQTSPQIHMPTANMPQPSSFLVTQCPMIWRCLLSSTPPLPISKRGRHVSEWLDISPVAPTSWMDKQSAGRRRATAPSSTAIGGSFSQTTFRLVFF